MWRQEFDSNEPKTQIHELLKIYPEAIVHKCYAGDYNCYWLTDEGEKTKYFRIESKTPTDLMNSSQVQEGEYVARLWRQLSKMKPDETVALLLKGVPNAEQAWGRAVDIRRYIGIMTAAAKSGAVVLPVMGNIKSATEAISSAFELHMQAGGRFYPAVRPFSGIAWQQGALSVYPGIGGVKAKLLYDRYNSFDELMAAEGKELVGLLGRSAGTKLYENLHGHWR